jgi:hypothetical protein
MKFISLITNEETEGNYNLYYWQFSIIKYFYCFIGISNSRYVQNIVKNNEWNCQFWWICKDFSYIFFISFFTNMIISFLCKLQNEIIFFYVSTSNNQYRWIFWFGKNLWKHQYHCNIFDEYWVLFLSKSIKKDEYIYRDLHNFHNWNGIYPKQNI